MDGRTLRLRGATGRRFEQVGASTAKLTVTVLMGGPSAEREVSLASGAAVAQALAGKGHRVIEGDVGADDLSALDRDDVDVVFPVLHGTFGEDGQLQAILEERGIRYAGSDAVSSALAMDKYRAKAVFREAGLLSPPAALIAGNGDDITERTRMIEEAVAHVGLPCVVKPNAEGSSIGVIIADDEHIASEAAHVTLARYGECLIEGFVAGREVTVGIFGGVALPAIEVRTSRRFYDYEAKYEDDGTEYNFDIPLERRQLIMLQRQAARAFTVLGCRDFGRVDFIVDEAGRGHVLEINTIPGFTSHSLLPKAAKRAGLSMGQLCERIAQMAYSRPI